MLSDSPPQQHMCLTEEKASYAIPKNNNRSYDAERTAAADDKNGVAVAIVMKETPGVNDVLCGRGNFIHLHPGNAKFRQLVEKHKRVYLSARFKKEKRFIAESIVSEIRNLHPPGRFLSRSTKHKNKKKSCWVDVGDEKARDKTLQALRG